MTPPSDPYERKRDFRKTPEPRGDERPRRNDDGPLFVIQAHDASCDSRLSRPAASVAG